LLKEEDTLAGKYFIVPFPKPDTTIKHSSNALTTPESVIVKRQAGQTKEDEGLKEQQNQGVDSEKITTGGDHGDDGWEKLPAKNDMENNQTDPTPATGITMFQPFLVTPPLSVEAAEDIIVWEGSTAANLLICRGWSRSEEEWAGRIDPLFRKKDPNLKRGLEDPKFRTRLCNHWNQSLGTFCPMRKKNKCVFAHGPVELRVKEPKRNRWGKLLDKDGNNSNPCHSGGEDTYGAACSIETV
jgi:hypothetical protein